jgi:hypothetical protein
LCVKTTFEEELMKPVLEIFRKIFCFCLFYGDDTPGVLNERGYGIDKLSDWPDMLSICKDSFKKELKYS